MELVFVYGTLRRGASNHWRMDGAEFLGKGCVHGKLYKIDWYPGLVLDPMGPGIHGEVYRVPADLLRKLDEFEGVAGRESDEYERVLEEVNWIGGDRREKVWVWQFRHSVDEKDRIVENDWMKTER